MQLLRVLLGAVGVILIALGSALLFYLGLVVYQVINHPSEVEIVRFILEKVQIGDKAIYGTIGPQSIELNISEATRAIVYMLTGVLILSVLASILNALISGGVKILSLVLGGDSPKKPESCAPALPAAIEESASLNFSNNVQVRKS